MMKRLSGSGCSSSPSKELQVAIIGAGACGLVAARVLDRSPLVGISSVTVLEREDRCGGIWNYTRKCKPHSPTKCSSTTSSHEDDTVDSRMYRPMYRALRTNLPSTIMAYREFPWVDHQQPTDEEKAAEEGESSFVTHDQILKYLNHYAQKFDLHRLIRYNCSVQRLAIVENDASRQYSNTTPYSSTFVELLPRIELTWKDTATEVQSSQIFDAVLICNGHYAKPFTPHIDGMKENFKGHIMHSIQYDDPSIFVNKTVVCVGGGPSGSDLAREISKFAKHVYLSISNNTDMMMINNNNNNNYCNNNTTRCFLDHASVSPNNGLFTCDNITLVPSTVRVDSDSTVLFQSNSNEIYKVPNPDVLIFCTGYEYDFPFLNEGSTSSSTNHLIHQAQGQSVSPLYKQLWHARYPNIAFLGLPFSVLPFPLFELQAEAVVSQLLNIAAIPLPPLRERLQIIPEEDSQCSGQPMQDGITISKRIKDTHYLGKHQWNYCRNMAEISGTYNSQMMQYLTMNQAIYEHSTNYRLQSFPGGPDTYRNMRYIRNDQEQKFTVISGQVTQVISIQKY
jgi:hypothetical protein